MDSRTAPTAKIDSQIQGVVVPGAGTSDIGGVVGSDNIPDATTDGKASAHVAQHLAAIIESSDDAIVSKDVHGIVQSWNRAAERMFGYSAPEIVGKSILTIIPEDRRGEEDLILTRIRTGERIDHFETVRRAKDGNLIDVSLTVSPIKDDSGKVTGASKIARDIRAKKQAEAIRELLLHEVKHRVKNMLAAVQAFASQSFRSASQAERDHFLGRLQAMAQAHDLLTQQNWEGASVVRIAKQATLLFTDRQAEESRVSLDGPSISLPPNKALLLAMVLHELGMNALKYGALSNGEGRVELSWASNKAPQGTNLSLCWREVGGPLVATPTVKGFGTRLIEQAIAGEHGAVTLEFVASGLECLIDLPLSPGV